MRRGQEKIESNQRNEYSPEEPIARKKGNRNFTHEKFETNKAMSSPDMIDSVHRDDRRKEYMPVRTIVNVSDNVTEALIWKTGPSRAEPNPNPNAINSLQNKFQILTQEQARLQNEIDKVSESRHPNSVKRKNELELEISICQSNINSITSKLRKLNWLSSS